MVYEDVKGDNVSRLLINRESKLNKSILSLTWNL